MVGDPPTRGYGAALPRHWVTQNYTKKSEMPPVSFVGILCKIHAVLYSKVADPHDVRTWKFVCFRKIFQFSLQSTRDAARGASGHNSPGAESLRGVKKAQQCHKHIFQNSTFASETPQVRTWGRQICFLLQAPSNPGTPLHNQCQMRILGTLRHNFLRAPIFSI